jgi:hypothetical protein
VKDYAASALSRGLSLSDDGLTFSFVERAQWLAICRAARDAHRAECEGDALERRICQNHSRAIASAKQELRHNPQETVGVG